MLTVPTSTPVLMLASQQALFRANAPGWCQFVVHLSCVAAIAWTALRPSGARRAPMLLLAVGGGLNSLAMLAGGGRMPVMPAALAAVGRASDGELLRAHTVGHGLIASTIGDNLAVTPLRLVASPGDVVLLIAVLAMLVGAARADRV